MHIIKYFQKWTLSERRLTSIRFVAALGLMLTVPLMASADSNSAYYAIYCGQDSNVSIPSNHQGQLQCQTGSPSVEATVKSPTTDPNGDHSVSIVQADCYPNSPASGAVISGNHIQCSDGPDATLTLLGHFAAKKNPTNPGGGKNPGGNPSPKTPAKGGGGGGGGGGSSFPKIPHTPISTGSLPKADATVGGPNSTFGKIMSILFGIIAAFALLNIVLSGMKYITSAGNPQKTSEAKNGIAYSLVGLIIAISAEAIIAFVIDKAST